MKKTIQTLVERLQYPELKDTNVISWGAPIPSFGDCENAFVATLGLNPSNREFVDNDGNELDGEHRRFHSLRSLGLNQWDETSSSHLGLMSDSCRSYFSQNPYDRWFRKLDWIISGTETSYYSNLFTRQACHLDLIPYATECKWTDLTKFQRAVLLRSNVDTLGTLLRDSSVHFLVLNGKSVVEAFENVTATKLSVEEKKEWSLPRKSGIGVRGFAYRGEVSNISGIDLGRQISVLGFNHNLQSSFGVTNEVMGSIKTWMTSQWENLKLERKR